MVGPLVSPSWLEDHLDDSEVHIIEVTMTEDDSTYRDAHIPGATWQYWKDLCWHESDREFPEPAEMATRLGKLGISDDTTLVLYGDPVQFGSYAFWALTMGGHKDLRLLDGGRKGWVEAGRPVTTELPNFEPAPYIPGVGDISMRMGRDDVLAGIGKAGRLLLDVRSPEEYSGERVMPPPNFDHGAERKGRIPGANHLFFRGVVNDDDTYKKPSELRALFEEVGASEAEEIVGYCRLSHRATLVWFALRYILGYESVRIYDGSWTEWGSIVGFPIER